MNFLLRGLQSSQVSEGRMGFRDEVIVGGLGDGVPLEAESVCIHCLQIFTTEPHIYYRTSYYLWIGKSYKCQILHTD